MTGRRFVAVGGILVVAGVAVAGYAALRVGLGPLADPEQCSATVDQYSVALSTEQAENASIIGAVAARRGLPGRAITIAIATAYQESDLENLGGGDRDSLGLFQQRPSQGWGTREQIMDPYYASNAFFDALVAIDGYQDMEITDAAQEVQHSGFPDAYADHESDGRAIASALSGYSGAAFTCVVHEVEASSDEAGANGLTPRASEVKDDLAKAFGEPPLGGFPSGRDGAGQVDGSAGDEGRALDVRFRPVSAGSTRHGWVVAHYLVANAARLDIEQITFDDHIWTAGSTSEQGWRDYEPRDSDGGALVRVDVG